MNTEQNGSKAGTPSPERLGSVNWRKDEWFDEHHADNLTDEFKAWWIENYYGPDKYGEGDDEQHEYWTRCAFALMGWNAARKPKLYLVSDGEYSDYHLCCVCSSKDKADHAKKFFASSNDIEEYELDALPDHPRGMFWYSVKMDRNGNTLNVEIENGNYAHADKWRPYGDNETVSFYMWATDEKRAIKIANERRAMIVASGEWTTDFNQWDLRKQNAGRDARREQEERS